MAWSTSELARLAGTTVNTVRHYHRLGLLGEPGRSRNGYKQYGAPDLVRLLRIRRLAELGVPLSRIAELDADGGSGPDALRQADADHVATIERLEKARQDIAAVLLADAPADAPPGFESVAARLSEADQSLVHIYAQVYDDDTLKDLKRMVENDTDPIGAVIDTLPPDADEATRQRLAERLAPTFVQLLTDHPWLNDPAARLSGTPRVTARTFAEAVSGLYNPAQLDVLRRAGLLAQEQAGNTSSMSDD